MLFSRFLPSMIQFHHSQQDRGFSGSTGEPKKVRVSTSSSGLTTVESSNDPRTDRENRAGSVIISTVGGGMAEITIVESPTDAYRRLFRDNGLPEESFDRRDLRLYRMRMQTVSVDQGSTGSSRAGAPSRSTD